MAGTYNLPNGFVYLLQDVLRPAWIDRTLSDVVSYSFSILSFLFTMAGSESMLRNSDEGYTVFAPHDNALNDLGDAALQYLESDEGMAFLKDMLKCHIAIGGPLPSASFGTSISVETLQGGSISLSQGSPPKVQGAVTSAFITSVDLLANNGLVHEIDAVLLPEPFPTRLRRNTW